MRRRTAAVGALCTLLVGVAWATRPARLGPAPDAPKLPPLGELADYLAKQEALARAEHPLIDGTEKRIVWHSEQRRTPYSVVYLHGFSATRQETAPTSERIAAAFGANLFETRLRGHGRAKRALEGVVAEDWLEDGVEALAVGSALGERVVLIGASTGATLALALEDHPLMKHVSALVLISPNFRPFNAASQWLTRPGGPLLLRLMAGSERSWEPHNEAHGRYWSTHYKVDVLVEMMRLVDGMHDGLPIKLGADVLVLYGESDQVVSVPAMKEGMERISAPRKHLVAVQGAEDPSQHVIAGDILSPSGTSQVVHSVLTFVREQVSFDPARSLSKQNSRSPPPD